MRALGSVQAPDRVDRFQFGEGYATTAGTLQVMADTLQREHLDPRIRTRMRQILRGAQLQSMDVDGEIAAVWDFILANVRYVRDPLGAEHITAPVELDREVDDGSAMEDCESIALYAATLLASVGIPSEFEIQGRRPNRPDRFTHCALRVQNPRSKQWISFDPIGAWEYPGYFGLGDTLHREGEPIQHFTLDGVRAQPARSGGLLTALLGDAYGDLQQVKKYGTPAAQGLTALGPYGMIIGGLFQGATAIADTQVHPSAPAAATSTIGTPQNLNTTKPGGRGRFSIASIAQKYITPEQLQKDEQAARAEQAAAKGTGIAGPVVALGAGLLLFKLLF